MNEEHEESRPEHRRPRVVDKRVSAGGGETEPSRRAESGPTGAGGASETADVAEPTPPADAPATASSEGPSSDAAAPDAGPEQVWTPEQEAEARRIAEEMARIPALDWVANSAVTLVNVAAAKLDRDDLAEARLAIDALAAVVTGLGDRLGDVHAPLRQTLAQLQMAYAQKTGPAS